MIVTSVILAGGKGTRMRSDLPKVLHPILEKPMILYALDTAAEVTGRRPVLVVGHGAQQVRAAVGNRARCVCQREQKGTGHALRQAEKLLRGRTDIVLVTSGDMPLLTVGTLKQLVATHLEGKPAITLLTVIAKDPRGFGRIVRTPGGGVSAIVEESVATPEQLAIRELNAGAYAIHGCWLWGALRKITLSPAGEYYLTDLVEIANREGRQIQAVTVEDESETIGVNTPAHRVEAERVLSERGR